MGNRKKICSGTSVPFSVRHYTAALTLVTDGDGGRRESKTTLSQLLAGILFLIDLEKKKVLVCACS